MKQKSKFWRYLFVAEVLTSIGLTGIAGKLLESALKSALGTRDAGRLAAIYAAQSALEERRGKTDRAIELLKKAIEVAPVDEVGIRHFELAMLYKNKEDYETAAVHFSQALKLLSAEVSPKFREDVEVKLQECRRVLGKR